MCAPFLTLAVDINKNGSIVVGVDVGGTNTDAVVLSISSSGKPTVERSAKCPSTEDVMTGVVGAIKQVARSEKEAQNVDAVVVGTTKFVNAVLSQSSELSPVAVVRLCGTTTRIYSPFLDFPEDSALLMNGFVAFVDGGYEVDGKEIDPVNEEQIIDVCNQIKKRGIITVAVCGVFSSINSSQENSVGEIMKRELGDYVYVTLSHEIGELGLLKRENAAILNASLRPLARKFISALKRGIREKTALSCPLLLTQNDGTLLPTKLAQKFPVRTFACGPTNSMRGAALLSGEKDALVIDIGGTSTDIGTLKGGFPRPTSLTAFVGGIPTNFNMPEIISIALGGGTTVEAKGDEITFGQSVGSRITEEALTFGGSTPTTTDYGVAANMTKIGDPSKISHLHPSQINKVMEKIREELLKIIEASKVTADPVKVVLVGGGSMLVDISRPFPGVSEVLRPEHYEVANAVGAAICQVSGKVDIVLDSLPDEGHKRQERIEAMKLGAIDLAIAAGAVRETIKIIEVNVIPLTYVPNTARIIVKVVGDLDMSKLNVLDEEVDVKAEDMSQEDVKDCKQDPAVHIPNTRPILSEEKVHTPPQIDSRESDEPFIDPATNQWILTPWDVEKIRIGCSILASGGGGRPDSSALLLKNLIAQGKKLAIMRPDDMKEGQYAVGVANMGAPTISMEKPNTGTESTVAMNAVASAANVNVAAIICLEIGGSNAMQPLLASTINGLPSLDGDTMGRAFPRLEQTTFTLNDITPNPVALADDKGNVVVITKAKSFQWVERLMRAVCGEVGAWTPWAFPPLSREQANNVVIPYGFSHSWKIGNIVMNAQKEKSSVSSAIANYAGGKVVFQGRIIDVNRITKGGFDFGIVVLEGSKNTQYENQNLRIDLQNEFLLASVFEKAADGKTDPRIREHKAVGQKIIGSVPDIITLLLQDTGLPVFSEEVRYGLYVSVLCLPVHEQLRSEKALEVFGPQAFQLGVEYKPIGPPQKIESVIPKTSSQEAGTPQFKNR